MVKKLSKNLKIYSSKCSYQNGFLKMYFSVYEKNVNKSVKKRPPIQLFNCRFWEPGWVLIGSLGHLLVRTRAPGRQKQELCKCWKLHLRLLVPQSGAHFRCAFIDLHQYQLRGALKTLPEAQRTQGIESIT